MIRCIGCGSNHVGDRCADCHTSRGARFAEQVAVHRGGTVPSLCCCCLEPSTTSVEIRRRSSVGTVTIARLPSCRSCKHHGIAMRVTTSVLWVVFAAGLAVAGSKLVPAHRTYAVLVGLVGAIPLALALSLLLFRARIGHTPRCQPAKLGRDVGGTRIFEFRNRAFAEMVRVANPSVSPPRRVQHAIREMRAGLGLSSSR